MGQDLSVVLTDHTVHQAALHGVLGAALTASDHAFVVLVFGVTPVTLPPLAVALPAFTAFSVWADGDTSGRLQVVAEQLSALSRSSCVVLTAADHSLVGGWEFYREGRLVQDQWCSGNRYLDIALEGLSHIVNAPLPLSPLVQDLGLVSLLAEPTSGICLRSRSPDLVAGQSFSSHQLTALFEADLLGFTLECLLGGAA